MKNNNADIRSPAELVVLILEEQSRLHAAAAAGQWQDAIRLRLADLIYEARELIEEVLVDPSRYGTMDRATRDALLEASGILRLAFEVDVDDDEDQDGTADVDAVVAAALGAIG